MKMESAAKMETRRLIAIKKRAPLPFNKFAHRHSAFIALVAIWLFFAIFTDGIFVSSKNLSNLFMESSTTAILAMGMVLIIVAGHIDLSVGSVMGFAGAVSALFMIKHGWSVFSSISAALLVGTFIGAWHGFWVAYRRVPAFIVTLSSYIALRGLLYGITDGQTLGLETAPEEAAKLYKLIGQGYLPTFSAPLSEEGFHDSSLIFTLGIVFIFIVSSLRKRSFRIKNGLDTPTTSREITRLVGMSAVLCTFFGLMTMNLGIPLCIILVIGVAVSFSFMAKNTTLGRHLYAIGGNPDAARLAGINIRWKIFLLFILMGFTSSLAGVVYTARCNAATTSAGQYVELDAIASAVIGGTTLMGGEGTIFGALIGALVMTSLDNGMRLMNLDSTWQYAIKGMILLLVVWSDVLRRRRH